MDEPELQRPLLQPRTRRTAAIAVACAGALFTGGMFAGATLHRTPTIEHITVPAAPINVSVPLAPPPVVSVNVPPPEPLPPPPAPPVVTPAPSDSPPRPLVPRLWPQCVATFNDGTDKVCGWADGFPAIAGDGSLIATKVNPDDSGRGNPGLEIHFLDAHTGKSVRTVVVLSPDEYVVYEDSHPEQSQKDVDRMQAKIRSQTLAVQKTLDDGHYRTLAFLGDWDRNGAADTASTQAPHAGIYAEIADSADARIVDPATNTVLWQYSFATGGASKAFLDGEGMCGGWGMRGMSLWWDPSTRVVMSSQDYQTGGCMCSDETIEQVVRMPALQQ